MALERLRLDGQVAIVTGAGRGVGRGIANVLSEAGAIIVGTARTPTEVGETVEAIKKKGGKAIAITGDAMSKVDAQRIVQEQSINLAASTSSSTMPAVRTTPRSSISRNLNSNVTSTGTQRRRSCTAKRPPRTC